MTARQYELIGMLNKAATSANGSANWLDMLREDLLGGNGPRDSDIEDIAAGLCELTELVKSIRTTAKLMRAAPGDKPLSGRPLDNSVDGALGVARVVSGKGGEK